MHDEMIENSKTKCESDKQTIPVPTLDYETYRTDLAALELTKEQEDELLLILWDIMRTMCDLSLDMDSVHMIVPSILQSAFEHGTNDDTDTTKQHKE